MYKLYKSPRTGETVNVVIRLFDNACIPFDPDNTDYQAFKSAINAQTAQLEDADGNLMTPEQAITYVETLP
jgi:hypothetical protein